MIRIEGRTDLEALNHVQTLESITDNAIRELKLQSILAQQVIEELGARAKAARRYRRAFLFASGIALFWWAFALVLVWRAVR